MPNFWMDLDGDSADLVVAKPYSSLEGPDELFERLEIEEESPFTTSTMIRCACGATCKTKMPSRCEACQEIKPFWTEKSGKTLRLQDLDVGRLSMIARTLGTRAETYITTWPEEYQRIEIALDIVYAEIATRDKEIEQQRGILRALTHKTGPHGP